jgi:hypothetical protein
MTDSQKFYDQHHQALLDARHRMDEDEQFRSSIQALNQHSKQFCPIFIDQWHDSVPVVIIRDYSVSQKLMSAIGSPFAKLSIAELGNGFRVDRFLALAVQWLLRADLKLSPDIRILMNNVLTEVRRQAVSWLLRLSSLIDSTLYFHRWTLFLNCALGRRACLHFQSRDKYTSMFPKMHLNPRGFATVWRLVRWTESKSNTIYTDLEFELLEKHQIKRTFCFPKNELHCLSAITFDGQELLPHRVLGCRHVQDAAFWEHQDPYMFKSTSISDLEPLPHDSHDPKRTETQHIGATDGTLLTCEPTFSPSDASSDQNSPSRPSQSVVRPKSKSCSAIRSLATQSEEPVSVGATAL